MRDIEHLLERTTTFAGLDAETIAALASRASRRAWDAGTLLFQRGDAGDYLLALTSGRVRLSLSTPLGKELVLRHMGPGEVIGEFALIDGDSRSADATVVEAGSGILIYRDSFLQVAETRPLLGLALARHLCRQLRGTNFQMETIALYDLRARVAHFLLFALREQHGRRDLPRTGSLRLKFALNQSELALLLGASRPKVNQILQALATEGVIEREDETLLCDLARLHDATDMPDGGPG